MRPRDPADEARDVEKGRHEDEAEKGRAGGAPIARGKRLHESGGPERREREDEGGRERDSVRVRALGIAREESARQEDRDGDEEKALDAGAHDAGRGAGHEKGPHARQDDGSVRVAVPGEDIPTHEKQRSVVADVREKGAPRFPRGPGEDREIPHVRRQALRLPRVREREGCDDDDLREKRDERQATRDAMSLGPGGDGDDRRQRESQARRRVSRRPEAEQSAGRDRPRGRGASPGSQACRGGRRHDCRGEDDVTRPPRLCQQPE